MAYGRAHPAAEYMEPDDIPTLQTPLGLVARWSPRHMGYVSIMEPTTGEWHDLSVKDAPYWAVREARERRDLKKYHGVWRTLTRDEMERHWERKRAGGAEAGA